MSCTVSSTGRAFIVTNRLPAAASPRPPALQLRREQQLVDAEDVFARGVSEDHADARELQPRAELREALLALGVVGDVDGVGGASCFGS